MRPIHALPAALLLAPLAAAQETLFDVSGATADAYGQVCDLVGDMNGDGFAEFLVGAWQFDTATLADAGAVFVYSGADGSLLTTIEGTGGADHMGFGSSSAGDMNGDGFADVCAAADEDNVPGIGGNAGSATVYSGADGSVLHAFTGTAMGELFGWATAAVGDVNGDGRDDLLVGSLQADPGGLSGAGALTVFSGLDGSVIHRVYGDVLGGQLGSSVGRVGDVDGDGRLDFAGAQGNLVRIFSGLDGTELRRRSSGGGSLAVAGGIDANGDGFDDWIIGAPGVSTTRGRVQVISGADNSILHEILGVNTGDQLGAGVVGAGDLDGDGYGDFAYGIPGFDGAAGNNTGAVRAHSGRTGAELFTIEGDLAADRIGSTLGGGHDVNGDGIADVVASSIARAKAKVVSFVPDGLEPFGTGTPGCRGSSSLLANGVPTLGNAGFALHVSAAGALPTLLIGDTEDTAGSPFFGALFHLDPAPPAPAVGVLLARNLPAPDANASVVAPLPIPNDPSLVGLTTVFQVVSVFPRGTCAQRLTTSRGLRVTVR